MIAQAPADARADVVILGGGLAGLSLAIQLRRREPDLQVVVLERNAHPVREAAFKVGESTVEIGAHYFAHVLGLRAQLDAQQISKFGFRFFFSEGRSDIDQCAELGVSAILTTPSWQLDRGRFENFLGEHARALGVDFRDQAVVRGFELGEAGAAHVVRYEHLGEPRVLEARWLVDAAGRAGLVKRKLGLARPNAHNANAVWWRVEGVIDPNDWSDDPQWRQRTTPPDRWRSTNHMCGPGYWFWLIPLASGAHSLGIVCDADMHPLESMNTHAKAMAWLQEHQPRVARSLQQQGHALKDFKFLRDFSYGCEQVFSADRWALTGEAGVFLDPLYSPGSDFIAISNGYVSELIARDRAGQRIDPYVEIYQQLYFSFYENTLTLYQDQYALLGDAQVMPLKVMWDYTFYWALLAPLFFADRLTHIGVLGQLRDSFDLASGLNAEMQPLLREWSRSNSQAGGVSPERTDGRMLDQREVDWFAELNRALDDELDDGALVLRIRSNVALLRALAAEMLQQARLEHPRIDPAGLEAVLRQRGAGAAAGDTAPLLSPQWYA
ncbi:MAG: tryptophan 7-halogenase, partial [Lysobacter sp.]|nr:tryptophan 7-halogenase [Lysobacter sp.]MDQ3268802.1 tryptophan 7-halogenase [Pseudomonadota bacterium]